MKILLNFIAAVFSIVVLVGCGGGGRSSDVDVQLPYVEKSEFFTSFELSDSDIEVEKGLAYYPISDSVSSDFTNAIIGKDFKVDEDDEYCYTTDNKIAYTCLDVANVTNKRYIAIWFENTTIDIADEEIIEFFPKIDTSLSARLLSIDFNDNKSAAFAKHEYYLKNTLGFDYYNDGYSDKCLKKYEEGDIVYSFCYGDDDYASWEIIRKTLFDAVFQQ
ncbi:MAG: hypothetical protein LBG21_03990 [Campylobacteraceae bacterium]|jgi:hypothetical protein|nr:hypothetical protein [Campylobacteraceae bacterium]